MPFVQAKCPNCGGTLKVDNALDAAVCEFCNTAFIVEKAVNNYNTNVNIDKGANVHIHVENSGFEIEAGVLKKYTGSATEVIVPDGIREIAIDVFAGKKYITYVKLPDGLQVIGGRSFSYCEGLTSIHIPDSVTKIDVEAFHGCTSLTSVHLPNSLTRISFGTFMDCICLTDIYIPDSVTEIGNRAFYECKSLTTVSGCKNVRKIEDYAFLGCPINRETAPKVVLKSIKGCYIATAVYGSYDCPEVWTLRRYRDYTLQQSVFGRLFIKVYYAISPHLVKWFGKTPLFNKFWRTYLDRRVRRLQEKGYESAPYKG